MKYIRTFDTHAEYETYRQSNDFTEPNLSYCTVDREAHFYRVKPNPHLTIVVDVTSSAPTGGIYDLGDNISCNLTLTNDGNTELTNISVGLGVTSGTVESLAVGGTATINNTLSHTITEADILSGTIAVTAVASNPSSDTPTTIDMKDTNNVSHGSSFVFQKAQVNQSLSITSTVTSSPDNIAYDLGETIAFTISVENDGNMTLSDIDVNVATGNSWNIPSLLPGGTRTFNETHVVNETNIINGEVLIEISAEGDGVNNETIEAEDAIDVSVANPRPSLLLECTEKSTPQNGVEYQPGESVIFDIVATNNGNLTLTNVEVDVFGRRVTVGNGTLLPGTSATISDLTVNVVALNVVDGTYTIEVVGSASNASEIDTNITDGTFDVPASGGGGKI